MAQFVLEIEYLAFSMESMQLLEKRTKYGLQPR